MAIALYEPEAPEALNFPHAFLASGYYVRLKNGFVGYVKRVDSWYVRREFQEIGAIYITITNATGGSYTIRMSWKQFTIRVAEWSWQPIFSNAWSNDE